mmetsp:Transcript_30698/g.72465  ORF Transcript_30698/g.72465 Transcript_30698/m.72465 type:complete len:230 (+) Transcript_30698:337-1026(+)
MDGHHRGIQAQLRRRDLHRRDRRRPQPGAAGQPGRVELWLQSLLRRFLRDGGRVQGRLLRTRAQPDERRPSRQGQQGRRHRHGGHGPAAARLLHQRWPLGARDQGGRPTQHGASVGAPLQGARLGDHHLAAGPLQRARRRWRSGRIRAGRRLLRRCARWPKGEALPTEEHIVGLRLLLVREERLPLGLARRLRRLPPRPERGGGHGAGCGLRGPLYPRGMAHSTLGHGP